MRLVRILVRLLGWLLTPLVAWGASFLGAWLAAVASLNSSNGTDSLWLVAAVALLAALISLVLWLRLLRLKPGLRKALHLTPMGVPELPTTPTPPPADQI